MSQPETTGVDPLQPLRPPTSGPVATEQHVHPPEPEPPGGTRDPRVDDALSRLAELDDLPVPEHVDVYADIHRRLEAVLADPESRG